MAAVPAFRAAGKWTIFWRNSLTEIDGNLSQRIYLRRGALPTQMNIPGEKQENENLRLFYALWPDAATRKALEKWQPALKGRLVPPYNLHITLAFLGNQPASLLPILRTILNRLEAPALKLKLDQLGHFARNRVAWAGMTFIPPELLQLHAALISELKENCIRHDERPQFVPHLTLARNAARPAETAVAPPVEWTADHIALVYSPMNGSPYQVLASKRLK